MSRLYLRSLPGGALDFNSLALPVGSDNSLTGVQIRNDLSLAKGTSQTQNAQSTLAQTSQQSGGLSIFSMIGLTVGTIEANNWTIALATSEDNANANAFTAVSLYVYRASISGVLGYIYDSATTLGVEWATSEDGQVYTIAGAELGGVEGGDWLALEVWYVATQAQANSYNVFLYWDGSTDVTDSTTSNAASYIETPQDLFLQPAGLDGKVRPPRVRASRF